MLSALLTGVSLGFSAGISPGPLTTLVLTSTLERGFRAGLRVAIAPLLTDLPIIVVSLLIFSALPPLLEIGLTVAGGVLLVYLGIETLRTSRHAHLELTPQPAALQQDLWRGVLVNVLSPHPWLFWLSVGSPILIGAWRTSPALAALFLLGFYALLVGSKIAIAWGVAGARHLLDDRWYRTLLRVSGALLLVFAALLFWQATIHLPPA
ncbi:MAG: LysE family transporter [Caldilineaceae bacterium]